MSDVHYWKCRLVSKGPWVGVRTWEGPPLIAGETLDRSPRWQAVVRLETTGRAVLMGAPCPIEVDGVLLRNIEPISEEDYRFLLDHAAYATNHAPHLPDASPTTTINWNNVPPRI